MWTIYSYLITIAHFMGAQFPPARYRQVMGHMGYMGHRPSSADEIATVSGTKSALQMLRPSIPCRKPMLRSARANIRLMYSVSTCRPPGP
jgi:hypothetical protein